MPKPKDDHPVQDELPAERFVPVVIKTLPIAVSVQVPHAGIPYSRQTIGAQGSIETDLEVQVKVEPSETDLDALLRFYEDLSTRLLAIHTRVTNQSLASATQPVNLPPPATDPVLTKLAEGEI
jgi:hypothetical protein